MATTILIALFPVVQYLITGVLFGVALPIAYLFAFLVKWGIDALRGKQLEKAKILGQAAILVAGILLVHTLATMNNRKACNGVAPVLAAVQQYKADNHKYPADIKDLIPKYLPHRPMAKYVAVNSGYFIRNGKLGYVNEPTTMIQEFDLETGSESYRSITE
ncbi:MAG: hypothetical protein PHV36_10735 [Elusimicrobiales bacterium]|nr:hypothetical protein [Elusimicrobiales bacterium]